MPAQRPGSDLEGRVAPTHPAQFLPARRTEGRPEPMEVPRVLDSLDLGRARFLPRWRYVRDPALSALLEERG